MPKDDIIDQVRDAREQDAARFDYDLKKIIADARSRQKKSGHRVVSLAPKTRKVAPGSK
jgi:hypothetical protein